MGEIGMKKLIALAVTLFAAAMLFAADEFTVKSVKGKVTFEAEPGLMKEVKAGQKLSLSTVINTAVNSTLVVTGEDGKEVTIKAMKKGTVESLAASRGPAGKGISKGTVAKDSTAAARSSEKGTATASSRASNAAADYDWEQ